MNQFMKEAGIKSSYQKCSEEAVRAYGWAATVRASMNPEIEGLAPLYERIGDVWAAHAERIREKNPPALPIPRRNRRAPVAKSKE